MLKALCYSFFNRRTNNLANMPLYLTSIKEIVGAFSQGKIVCLPTDTVYAISCDATNNKAIQRIYSIKNRALNKPCPIFVSDINMAMKYVKFHSKELLFAKKFWAGPLTMILQQVTSNNLPSVLIKNGKIGIRIPDKALIREICANINKPIIATSANISSKPNINSMDGIEKEFGGKVDAIVTNDNNPQNLITSTIVEFINNDSYKIIREGRISKLELEKALPRV